MRGASLFHFAAGLAKLKYFSGRDIFGFGIKQLKFVLSGSENLEDVASATEAALAFVQGRSVEELSADSDRMSYLTPQEAVSYGLIDRVLDSRKDLPAAVG